MLKSYITIALRKLRREKLYVSINILSLGLGIASFIILALYLRSELTYDKHHVNHERIYRVTATFHKLEGRVDRFAVTQNGIGPILVEDYPQLGQFVRFRKSQQSVIKHEDIEHMWDDIYVADPAVFDVFTHKIIYGDPKTAFDTPYSIALSESAAKLYFGDQNPIGKSMTGGGLTFAVKLVFADLPENSHLKYSILLPMGLMEVFDPNFTKSYKQSLWGVGIYTYLMVTPEFDPADFKTLAKGLFDNYMAEQAKTFKGSMEAGIQPLADVHFGEKLEADLPTGNIFYVYGFAAVAVFILVVACINFMNLATARATKRAKEVGMRKVLGASKAQLVGQFLGESFTFTFLGLLLGLVLVQVALVLTPIGPLMGKAHLSAALLEPMVIVGIMGLGLAVALLAGVYPAFYLSAISPLAALTQVKRSWRTGFSMRTLLVLSQLVISIGVIACALLMTDQLRYIHEKPLGFDKENRLIVTLRGYDVVKNVKTIKSELRNQANVLDVTTIGLVPGTDSWINTMPVEKDDGTMESFAMNRIMAGSNFVEAMGIRLVEGRGFSEEVATDVRQAVIVNESFVEARGWQQAIGKRFQVGPPGNFARVVGVVEDFHYSSLHNTVGPMMMHPIFEQYDNVPDLQKPLLSTSIVVVMTGERKNDTLTAIHNVISKFDPKFQIEPVYLEDELNDLYKSESNLMKLTAIFSGICIFISVMGLFGLAAFTTEQRTKEIGIRKVLGASDGQIVALLTRHLLPLIVIGAIPASVLSYYAIDKWLQRFAYRTEIGWITFVTATLVVALVALATVTLQSLKTAQSEPVDALRYE